LEKVIAEVTFSPPSIDVVSGKTGELIMSEISTPAYWLTLGQPSVKLAEGIQTLQNNSSEIFVEIGFQGSLADISHNSLPEDKGVWLSSLKPGQGDWQSLLLSLGELYVRGLPVDWSGFDRDYLRQRLHLPTYPFQRQRYWFDSHEQDYQKSDFLLQKPDKTSILNLLNQGDTQQLAQLLVQAGNFSEDKRELLPELLDVLVREHQNQAACEVKQQIKTVDAIQQEPIIFEQLLEMSPLQREEVLRSYLRQQIAGLLQMNSEQIPIQGNLLEFGMDSLTITRVINRLTRDLQFPLYPGEVYQRPRIDALAKYLAREFERFHNNASSVLPSLKVYSKTATVLEQHEIQQDPSATAASAGKSPNNQISTVGEVQAQITRATSQKSLYDKRPNLQTVVRDGELPLSFAQQRLWFIDQLEPDSSAYNLPAAYRLTGHLNVTSLEQSLEEIVRRHEILRTTFLSVDGQPVQVISSDIALNLPLADLRELPEPSRQAEAQRLATEEAQRPFDLSTGPLFRFKILRLADAEYVLLLNMHHIISDGWSMGVFFQELAALYAAFSADKPSPLPELPIQYADFTHWQREWLQGEVLESQLDYWKQQLSGTRVSEKRGGIQKML
jgi:acyl transferase domain-containing protein